MNSTDSIAAFPGEFYPSFLPISIIIYHLSFFIPYLYIGHFFRPPGPAHFRPHRLNSIPVSYLFQLSFINYHFLFLICI